MIGINYVNTKYHTQAIHSTSTMEQWSIASANG